MSYYKNIARIGFSILVFAGIVGSQFYFDAIKSRQPRVPLLLIPAPVMRSADLGLHSATAAFFWVGVIQRFVTLSADRLNGLAAHIRIVNGLDPKFSYPYAFAALVLPAGDHADEAVQIAKAGLEHADPDWQIPYYLAVDYHIYLKDRKNAAIYMNIAASTPGAPANVKYVAATYGNRQDLREQTRAIWVSIYENSKDEIAQQQAEAHIKHIDILDFLEKAAKLFKERTGQYPKTLDELVTQKILKAIPSDPLGLPYDTKGDGKVFSKFEQ
ncbi:MAG: hypothetical protein HY617_02460 [Candidatus Sungbacteria bacterium]|nr:hypothetical protein [Candidatus Sungbacteria bacterium]